MLEQRDPSNQMPIAIKDSKIDITSEKLTKELAKEFTKYLKGGEFVFLYGEMGVCLLYTSPSPRDAHESRMPSSA